MSARCRFAPSPTGYLHVGGAQSALFNWLFARGNGAEFLLRIEDTDAERNRPELTENILEMLRWLGIDWDGEPFHQSDHLADHQAAAEQLFAAGHAYYCDCTAQQVQARNKAAGGKPGYDGHCRDRGLAPGEGRALRFRSPEAGETAWDDMVRGKVVFENSTIEDFVLLRSNGLPTFLLPNVVDDATMRIDHVIRGEDHVNGTPKYLLLRAALGYGEPPVFAHLPLLVNEQRKKLSKRRDDVSVAEFKDRGFLPGAMRNYLALLGWGPADGVEIRPIGEVIELFRIEDVNPSPAFFDVKKLTHINSEYIRAMPVAEFIRACEPFIGDGEERRALSELASLAQQRVKILSEVSPYFDWVPAPADDPRSWEKAMGQPIAAEVLERIVAAYREVEWRRDPLHEEFLALAEQLELSPRKLDGPLRVALTGRTVGLPLFEVMEWLGRDETLRRLEAARSRLA